MAAVVLVLAICHATGTLARADQIVAGEYSYPAAKITAYEEGRVAFRVADGTQKKLWVDQVELIVFDRGSAFGDFNQAERYLASGEYEKAIVRYRRARRNTDADWVDLPHARLLIACDRAGKIDQAAQVFIRIAREAAAEPISAARLFPQNMPDRRSKNAIRAIEELDAAVATEGEGSRRVLFELLRFQVLHAFGDERAIRLADQVVALDIPERLRFERVYSVQLIALQQTLGKEPTSFALIALDQAVATCPDVLLPAFLLLKGETLFRTAATRKESIRAGWAFMRVAVHMADTPEAAEGLYGAARVMKRIGRPDKAALLLDECLAHKRLSATTKNLAQAMVRKIKEGGGPSG